VNALIPLLSFFTGSGDRGGDFISQFIEKFFILLHVPFDLPYLLIFISLLFLLKAIALLAFNFIKAKIKADYERQTRDFLFRGILKANWPYLLRQKLGYLETVLMTNVQNSTGMLESIGGAIMIVTGLFMYLLVAINISVMLTVMTLGVGVVLLLIFKPLIWRIRQVARKTESLNRETARHINENILGMKTVKFMLAEEPVASIGARHFDRLRDFKIRTFWLQVIPGISIQPISVIFISVIFAFSFYYSPAAFSFAALAVIIYLIQRIFTYIQMLQSTLNTFSNLTPYLQGVLRYQDEALENKEEDEGLDSFQFKHSLELKNIQFSYQDEKLVLSDLSLEVKKGEMVGLIGLSGSGKTTIFDLLLRLFKPVSGKILLDGKDISRVSLKEWRGNIEYVSQDLFLMNDTIANNIRFYDESITEQEIIEASKKAHIYDFIESLPQGFETAAGERGVRLSAGQRQRIAIARALVRKPKILLLDEATSALDNESEVQIQTTIEQLKGRTTIIVIAHRLSTVVNSDQLLVLENGRIIERGKPKELLRDKQSYFYKVYNIRK